MSYPRTPLVPRTKDFRRTTFTKSDRIVLRALAEAMFGEDGDVSAAKLDSFVHELDGFVSPASRGLRFGLRMMLLFFQFSPILLFFSLSTFENLSVHDRVKVLEKVDRSRVALAALSLVAYRTLMTMVFYEDSEELALLGYPGEERTTYLRLKGKSA